MIDRLRERAERIETFSAAALAVGVWALTANFARIGFPSQTFDEPFYATAAWRYIHGDTNAPPTGVFSSFDNFEHPPFAKYLFGIAQLFAGHPSVVADRVVASLCTVATAAVLGVWLAAVAGRWIGLGAGALVAVVPMSVPNVAFRFGRYGDLDPVAELFAVTSVVLAWAWFRRNGRAGWWYAIATGAAVGLAAASKENGFLGAVGPVLLGLVLLAARRGALLLRLAQALTAVAVSCGVFAATYLGLGHPWGAFEFMLRYQRNHARLGHRTAFAGRVSLHPPGWAFLWFAQHGMGLAVTVACVVCACAAIALRHDRLVLWCVAALAAPLVFHMFFARVVLSYYWVMWMPLFLALVALGIAELARRSWQWRSRAGSAAAAVVALACVAVLIGASARDTYAVLTKDARPPGSAYQAAVLARSPLVYLRLGERGGVIATDTSSHHHDGSYAGGPMLGAAGLLPGDPNTAVSFNGHTQSVSVPGATWMDVPDYSITVWFAAGAPSQSLVTRDDYRSKVWDVVLDAAGRVACVTFSPASGAGQPVMSSRPYDDGRAHLAVCTKDGTTERLYIDGQLAASASYRSFVRNTGPLAIDLARRGNGSGYLRGTLDEFAMYATPLSASDVQMLYRAAVTTGGTS